MTLVATVSTVGARPDAVALLPREPGVYRFRDERGRVLYVGRAADLRSRVGSYWGALRDRRHLRRMVPQIVGIEALVFASDHEAAWAERMLLEHRLARWNRVRGGMESPLYVRVDTTLPGITTAHEVVEAPGVRWYGPYLGGTATRLGVAGLERVHPLSYARARLTGTERDLGRIHGVDASDASSLVAAIDLALQRDPESALATRSALVAKREQAASSELYEVASRISDELGGFDWLVAPVRLFAADGRVTGAASGHRVSLTFGQGRLRTWEQAPSETDTMDAPQDWHDFLRTNATLAAALYAHPVG